VANTKLPPDFIIDFNKALEKGLSDIEKALVLEENNYLNCENPKDYLNNRISYDLDAAKKKGMELFLNKINY
jgi:hypothetical protein